MQIPKRVIPIRGSNTKTLSAMKQNNKVSDIFGVICVFAIFAGCVEKFDGGISAWTLVCLAVALLTGWISKKTEEK